MARVARAARVARVAQSNLGRTTICIECSAQLNTLPGQKPLALPHSRSMSLLDHHPCVRVWDDKTRHCSTLLTVSPCPPIRASQPRPPGSRTPQPPSQKSSQDISWRIYLPYPRVPRSPQGSAPPAGRAPGPRSATGAAARWPCPPCARTGGTPRPPAAAQGQTRPLLRLRRPLPPHPLRRRPLRLRCGMHNAGAPPHSCVLGRLQRHGLNNFIRTGVSLDSGSRQAIRRCAGACIITTNCSHSAPTSHVGAANQSNRSLPPGRLLAHILARSTQACSGRHPPLMRVDRRVGSLGCSGFGRGALGLLCATLYTTSTPVMQFRAEAVPEGCRQRRRR